jgi:hypothetical protein
MCVWSINFISTPPSPQNPNVQTHKQKPQHDYHEKNIYP